MSWLDAARDLPVAAVAEAFALEPGRPASGHPTFACPACGAETRHSKSHDHRGAVGLTRDGLGWRCHQCSAGGDALDLVAHAVGGARLRDLAQADRDRVRVRLLDAFPEVDDSGTGSTRPRPAPQRARGARETPTPSYPPPDELAGLWAASRPVTADAEVSSYLESRALEPTTIADADLARALSRDHDGPGWARCGSRPWGETGHRLLVQLVDAAGVPRSLIARSTDPKALRKSLAPSGFERRGLVLAGSLARQVLETGGRPSWWEDVPLRVVICEGEVDWLTWATRVVEQGRYPPGQEPACIGIEAGAWTAATAARIPDGAVVFVDTDRDEQGEKYAAAIVATFADRLRAGRVRVTR